MPKDGINQFNVTNKQFIFSTTENIKKTNFFSQKEKDIYLTIFFLLLSYLQLMFCFVIFYYYGYFSLFTITHTTQIKHVSIYSKGI